MDLPVEGIVSLTVSAVVLRTIGGVLRTLGRPIPDAPLPAAQPVPSGLGVLASAAGWLASGTATCVAAAAAGAWVAAWTFLVAGALGLAMDRLATARWAGSAADVLFFLAIAQISLPPLPWSITLVGAVVVAAAWRVLDAFTMTPSRVRRFGLGLLAVIGLVAAGQRFLTSRGDLLLGLEHYAFHAGVTPACRGEPIELPGGGRAWFDDAGSRAGALFLHGADPAGARQPAACVLRRALRAAGFSVLALDYPGFGETPAPAATAPVEAWDPGPAQVEAIEWLRQRAGVDTMIAVGHSMGSTAALRIASLASLDAVVLIGAAYGEEDAGEREDYWYERFHTDRGIQGRMDKDQWREIGDRYGDTRRHVAELPGGRVLAVFVTAEHEWDNIRRVRDTTFADLPQPKVQWPLAGATHYMTSFQVMGALVGDVRVAGRLAEGFERLRRNGHLESD